MSKRLADNFIDEMFALCLKEVDIFKVCNTHIEYSFFPNEGYKKVWKYLKNYFSLNGQVPTLGLISQTFSTDESIIIFLNDIKNLKLPTKQDFLTGLESFIKESKFILVYEELGELYNQGQQDKAFKKMENFANELASFSLKSGYYEPVFQGFNKRHEARVIEDASSNNSFLLSKAVFGIDELDAITGGVRIDVGDTCLFLAQSGVGKSTLARHIGVANARRNIRVAHFQLEGAKKEAEDYYDATWIGCSTLDVERANISTDTMTKIQKVIRDIGEGEIYIESFEELGACKMSDIESRLEEMEKLYGKFGLIIVDYLELADPSNGIKYKISEERFRREALASEFKNICVRRKVAGVTFTQGSTVDPELLNDSEFVQTRYNVAECKGIAKPFSLFITLNQTKDEYEDNWMRLYGDKFRKIKGGKTIKIATSYETNRFYDRRRTIEGETS